PDGGDEYAVVDGVARHGEDPRPAATLEPRAADHAVCAPVHSIDGARNSDPDLARRCTKSHTADAPGERALHAGRRDGLHRRDDLPTTRIEAPASGRRATP